MNDMPEMNTILDAIADPGIRGRCVHEYKTVRRMVQGRVDWDRARILDFGCGAGIAAASFALRHPSSTVHGVDILPPDRDQLEEVLQKTAGLRIPGNLALCGSAPGTLPEEVRDLDLIYAWSVFEHVNFADLTTTMALVGERLRPGGIFFLQINPLFHSPRGSHLYRFDPTPWVHLLLQHDVLERVVTGASPVPERTRRREWEQYETLNRAVADDIVDAAKSAGFSVLKEERLTTALAPPERLARIYQADVLTTEEIRLVLARQ